jgi:hypothetical protein
MNGRLMIVAGALFALGLACSSSDGGGAPVPGVDTQGLSADNFRCVDSTPADKSELSRALHKSCCCESKPHHIDGDPANIFVVDCSKADTACVNAVLDTNGFRNPPWSANIKSYPPCISQAVSYDPCGGICRNGGVGGGSGGGDEDGHCGN